MDEVPDDLTVCDACGMEVSASEMSDCDHCGVPYCSDCYAERHGDKCVYEDED